MRIDPPPKIFPLDAAAESKAAVGSRVGRADWVLAGAVSTLLHAGLFAFLLSEFFWRGAAVEPEASIVVELIVEEVPEPEAAEPEVPESEALEPELPNPDVAKAEPEIPESEPAVVEPEPEVTEAEDPEAAEPEPVEPETPESEVAEETPSEPEIAEPEVAKPDIAEPEIAEPEIAEPEVAEIEPAKPETAEPEIAEAEPEAPQQVLVDPPPPLPLPPVPARKPESAAAEEPPAEQPAGAPEVTAPPESELLAEQPAEPSVEPPVESPVEPPVELGPESLAAVEPQEETDSGYIHQGEIGAVASEQLLANLAALRDEDAQAERDPELWAVIRAVREQIARCWRVDADLVAGTRFSVDIDVGFGEDGRVTRARIQEVARMVNDDDYKTFVVDARDALMACSPFKLPSETYAIWRSFTMRFLPKGPV